MRAKRRTPAQRAATRKMIAANKARRAPLSRKRRAPARRRKNPIIAAPGYVEVTRAGRLRRPIRRRRLNPIKADGIVGTLVSATVGAGGALGAIALSNQVLTRVPALGGIITHPIAKGLFRAGIVILAAETVGKISPRNRRKAREMASGSLAGVMTVALQGTLAGTAAGSQFLGYVSPAPIAGSYLPGEFAPQLPQPAGTPLGEWTTLGEWVQPSDGAPQSTTFDQPY